MPITVGGTSITFNDGTTQTTAAGGAPTTAQVLSATAGASVGEVGTYAYLGETSQTSTSVGGTRAGSGLVYVGVQKNANGEYPWNVSSQNYMIVYNVSYTTSPSGTWRCMGASTFIYQSYSYNYPATLWLRIS